MWFAELQAGKIGRITAAGAITEFAIPTPASRPDVVTAGADGNVWFIENIGKIGRVTPTGSITEFPVTSSAAFPVGIVTGHDRNLWFAENSADKVARITAVAITTPCGSHLGVSA